jgi:phage protein D
VAALGVRLTVLAGPTIPLPLPAPITARLRSAQVTESDEERSAFTLTFDAGRSGPLAGLDTPLLTGSPVAVGARVVLLVTFGALPTVLMDGIVTTLELTPGDAPGSATLTATGEDVSVLLDREERDGEWPALDDYPQALAILAPYAAQGIVPMVTPPADMDPPLPVERVPTQHETDLRHLVTLAERHGYVAYVIPGPVPGTSRFYWGPPVRIGLPQPALSVDLGPVTNVVSPPSFRQELMTPVTVDGSVQDPATGATVPVTAKASLRPPLAALPLWAVHAGDVRKRRLRESGTTTVSAFARAQAQVDRAADAVVGDGELDGARYGAVLRPRGLVGVRGAGWSHDGIWYVRRVEHDLSPGAYRQKFTLAREGYGSTVPAVLV